MEKQVIKLSEAQLRDMVKKYITESINEGDIDEGRLGNFLSSVGKGAKEWWDNGGVNAFKQGYHQNMSDRSAADAAAYRKKVNVGYKDIPGANAIMQKYDGKIAKLKQQKSSIEQQISTLNTQKKQELMQARKKHMSNMTSQANKYGNTAKTSANRAQELQNSRRASLGLDPVQAAGQNPDTKTPPRMNVGQGA